MRTVSHIFAHSILILSLSFVPVSTALSAQAQPAPQAAQPLKPKKPVTPKKNPDSSIKGSSHTAAQSSSAQGAGNVDRLQKDLDIFAASAVAKMNLRIIPSLSSKEVTKTADGYRARYIAVDKDSLRTSYSPSEHKAVPYIGRMLYHEVEYVSVGKTREQALAGPFNEANRSPVTELIKYMKGKWTY